MFICCKHVQPYKALDGQSCLIRNEGILPSKAMMCFKQGWNFWPPELCLIFCENTQNSPLNKMGTDAFLKGVFMLGLRSSAAALETFTRNAISIICGQIVLSLFWHC